MKYFIVSTCELFARVQIAVCIFQLHIYVGAHHTVHLIFNFMHGECHALLHASSLIL
jgi:hypothetical protein